MCYAKMEPINTVEDSLNFNEWLEKVASDFNEFRVKMLQSNSNGVMMLEELVDSFIVNHDMQSADWMSKSTGNQFTALAQDFNEFESTMPPPNRVESTSIQRGNDLPAEREIQETEMIREMTERTSQYATETFAASSLSVNTNSCAGVGNSSNGVCREARGGDGGGGEAVLSTVMRVFETPVGGWMNFWRLMGINVKSGANTTRMRSKRKYRGIIETEEETARRMEQTKIKNREAADKANANRRAREAYMRTHLLKLHKKNEFLRKLVMFLESHKRINRPPQPLRRTISGPL